MASSTTTTIRTMVHPTKRPPPPKGPPARRPPPPPLPPAKKPSGKHEVVAKKRPNESTMEKTSMNKQPRRGSKQLHIKAPVILRDVTVFQRRQQVGEGTYGYVSFLMKRCDSVCWPVFSVFYLIVLLSFLFMYWFDQLGKSLRERRFGKTNIVNFHSRPLLTKFCSTN